MFGGVVVAITIGVDEYDVVEDPDAPTVLVVGCTTIISSEEECPVDNPPELEK